MSNLENSIAALDRKLEAIANDLDQQWQEKANKGKQGFISFAVITSCCLLAYHHAGVPLLSSIANNIPQENPLATPWDATGDAISGYPGSAIVTAAKQWEGKEFKKGVPAQCAVFVRYVFAELKLTMPVTSKPVDGLPPGEATANGFYGDDVGMIVKNPDRFQPGMVVLFGCTYGGYSCSTATHVGIITEKRDGEWWMIDRPTSHGKVRHRSINTFPVILGAVRPNIRRIER
jgi:hypothetical protein